MIAKELRIGNLVRFKNRIDFHAEIISINFPDGVEITRYFTDDDEDTQLESITDLTPIIIDPTWLIKLGFQATYGSNINGYWKYNINIKSCNYIIRLMANNEIFLFKNGNVLTNLKGVHHLQNIIFDLENIELNLID